LIATLPFIWIGPHECGVLPRFSWNNLFAGMRVMDTVNQHPCLHLLLVRCVAGGLGGLADPIPEPAVQAILTAFDKYEVVAMTEAHGLKDLDDFIFALIVTQDFQRR